MKNDSTEEKELNVEEAAKYLQRAFARATNKAGSKIGYRAQRVRVEDDEGNVSWEPTKLYNYQVEFMYLLDNIQRGPKYIAIKKIQEANELIAALESES